LKDDVKAVILEQCSGENIGPLKEEAIGSMNKLRN
jgi:hypothetical protein